VYGFERNSALDARNWFNKAGTPQTPLRLHQFGATVGGPVIKDKLFFFGGFEGIHDLVGNSFSLSSPATTSLPDAGNCPEGVTGDCANSIPDAILGVQAAGLPISPVGQSLANLFPTNTTGTPNIVLGFPNTNNGNKYLAWAFMEAANFTLRYCPEAKRFYERKKSRTNRIVALKSVAHKLARACYHILREQRPFDVKRCFV